MRFFSTLDILRGAVLFEIAIVFVLSGAIMALYSKRVRNPATSDTMSLHVIGAALGFFLVAVGVFWWTLDRMGGTDVHPSIYVFLVGYGVSVVSQYLMYRLQVGKFKDATAG